MYNAAWRQTTYRFADLKELLAKATPPRSGDVLAGVAANTAEENVAAKMALADVPLKRFLTELPIPYESDDVSRLIVDRRGRTKRLRPNRQCSRTSRRLSTPHQSPSTSCRSTSAS